MGFGYGWAGMKSFRCTEEDSVNIGIKSLFWFVSDSDFDMISVPGDDVDVSADYIRYEPNLCNIFPANL